MAKVVEASLTLFYKLGRTLKTGLRVKLETPNEELSAHVTKGTGGETSFGCRHLEQTANSITHFYKYLTYFHKYSVPRSKL